MAFASRMVVAASCIALLVSAATLALPRSSAEHFLEQSEDNYKVQFISGNLTASITKNWPRVDFEHSLNLLSPMFEVSISRLFLFNDTNGDGVFSRSETTYTGLMDDSYVKWNVSTIKFGQAENSGEFAITSMSSKISLYKGLVNQTVDEPLVRDWGYLTFSFMISQYPATYSNSLGQYVLAGKTDLRVVMDLSIEKRVASDGLALEQVLQAGGSVYTFLIREQSAKSVGTVLTSVSARDDERSKGINYTHRIQQTTLPTQDLDFATDKGVAQAYYRYSSVPTTNDSGASEPIVLNSSFYTTGTNLMLYTVYALGNRTDNVSHDMIIGLDMAGFVRARDWAMRNLPLLAVTVGGLAAIVGTSAYVWKKKRRMAKENGEELRQAQEEMDTGPK